MSTARRRGFNAERELARILWKNGFAVIRAPASGARARHLIYPDIVAIYKGKIYVFEVKYWRTRNIYITKPQLDKLREFAARAAATPLIAVKIPHRGWYIISPAAAKETTKGIKIDEEVINKAQRLEIFINSVINTSLENYTHGREKGQPGKLSTRDKAHSVRE